MTTGTATNRCVNRLDHLSSLSSDTATLVGMLFGSLCLPTGWHNFIYPNGMGAACNPAWATIWYALFVRVAIFLVARCVLSPYLPDVRLKSVVWRAQRGYPTRGSGKIWDPLGHGWGRQWGSVCLQHTLFLRRVYTPLLKQAWYLIIYQAPGLSVMLVYSGHFHPLSRDTLVDLQCLSSPTPPKGGSNDGSPSRGIS